MSELPPHPLAPLYSLSRVVLDVDGSTEEVRISAYHSFIEKAIFKEIVKYEVQYDHTELVNLMLQVMMGAINNYQSDKICCDAAIECIGRGLGEVLWSLPDALRWVQRLDEFVVDFVLDVVINMNPSKSAMHGYSRASSAILRWTGGYREDAQDAFSEKYADKFGKYLHRLDFEDMAILMTYIAVGRSAIDNAALISLVEERLLTEVNEKEFVASVAVSLLGKAAEREDQEKLEELIGRGFLAAARTLAIGAMAILDGEYLPDIVCQMDRLCSVMCIFPCCMAMIKRLLQGNTNRFAANLDTTIQIQPTRRATYQLEWEEEEESTADTMESLGEATQTRLMVARDSEGFSALSQNVLVKIVGMLPFAETAAFRSTCREAYLAVQISCEHLKLKPLIDALWPSNTHQFGTLREILREVKILTSWASPDLIKSIDFSGISTMASGQLEAAFGTAPLHSVKKLVLKDVIVLPTVWKQLSLLFPNVTTLTFTEASSQFPDVTHCGIEYRNVYTKKRAQLEKAGILNEDENQYLSDLATLFKKISKVYVDEEVKEFPPLARRAEP